MKENFFSSVMYGTLTPEDTIVRMRQAMQGGFGEATSRQKTLIDFSSYFDVEFIEGRAFGSNSGSFLFLVSPFLLFWAFFWVVPFVHWCGLGDAGKPAI
jgi:hypothetical protein